MAEPIETAQSSGPESDRPAALIAGGGLAGLSAAIGLADAGWRVHVLETRKRLGGRATSFTDPRTGETLDNCQHVALRCCTAYRRFVDRLGVSGLFRWDDTQWWAEAGGRTSVIKPSRLPQPLHYAPAFLAAKFLTAGEKLAVARAMDRIRRVDREQHRDQTFGELLRHWKQSPALIAKFWHAVIVGACNLEPDRVCAASALHVFQEGFLQSRDAGVMGIATVPLVRLYDRAEAIIRDAGGSVQYGASVTGIDASSVTLASGQRLTADRIVCALPFERATRVIDPALRANDDRFAAMDTLEHSPILGVHLAFDRPVLQTPHVVLVDRPTHWLFRKDDDGCRVHAVISAADTWMGLDEAAIVERVLEDIRACLKLSFTPVLMHHRAVKEKRATFAPTVSAEAARRNITPAGPSGLWLAGDWVDTGWPATMEGAVRSGEAVARGIITPIPESWDGSRGDLHSVLPLSGT